MSGATSRETLNFNVKQLIETNQVKVVAAGAQGDLVPFGVQPSDPMPLESATVQRWCSPHVPPLNPLLHADVMEKFQLI